MALSSTNETVMKVAEDAFKHPIIFGVRRLIYLALPSETSFPTVPDVPDYVTQAIPYFIFFLLLELVILRFTDYAKYRLNDSFSSLAAGLMSQIPLLLVRNIELSAYIWIYDRFNYIELPWDRAYTWWLAFLGVDFCYYWVHRFAHEVNFMWAGHQVHHSSEEYNLSTALRQSTLQRYSSWIFYLPLALFIPPSIFLVHIHFNLLYQFWIHTELIRNLGPLEYVMNTASHHRVHHGRNRYCIDKNYGGTLIIFDRMFGTFESEKDQVVYGLVHPLGSWDAFYTQISHWKWIISCIKERAGIMNKLKTLVYGPGWEPGKPRTGLIEDIPDIKAPQEKCDKNIPVFWTVYVYVHFALALVAYAVLGELKQGMSPYIMFLFVAFLFWTLLDISYIYEHKPYAGVLELFRCMVYLAVDVYMCSLGTITNDLFYIPRALFLLSFSVWLVNFMLPLLEDEKKAK